MKPVFMVQYTSIYQSVENIMCGQLNWCQIHHVWQLPVYFGDELLNEISVPRFDISSKIEFWSSYFGWKSLLDIYSLIILFRERALKGIIQV